MTVLVPENFPDLPRALVRDFERARQQLAGIAPRLRYAYADGRAQGLGHADAILFVQRLAAIRRRWHRDKRLCPRCNWEVLYRTEHGARVAIDQSARPHACPEAGL